MAERQTPSVMFVEQTTAHYAEMARQAGVEGEARWETRYHFTRNREHAPQPQEA